MAHALDLLPDSALSLISSLPSHEQQVLSYLVAVATRIYATPAPAFPSDRAKSLWKPWKNAAGSAFDAGKPTPAARQRVVSCPPLTAGFHQPTFGCDCFDCYSNFWSSWDASPHRDIIDNILELLDRHLDEGNAGRRAALSPQHSMSIEGKKELDKIKAVEAALSGQEEGASRRGKLSWKKHRRGERIRAGKTKRQTVVGGTIPEASVALTDPKTGSAGEVDGEKLSTSLPSHSLLSQDVLPGVLVDAHPLVKGFHSKNFSKQRGGKRKGKQVAPLDCDSVDSVHTEVQEVEGEVAASECATVGASSVALRVENSSFMGRGFLGRVFPDALGGVATRLWDLVSLRPRSQTTDFY